MNRNHKIASMDFAKADPESIRLFFMQKLDKVGILAELVKQDDTGELAEIIETHDSGLPYPEWRLIHKAIQDPFNFANKLDLALNSATIYSPGGGQLGSARVNPNFKASEPGRGIPYEKMDKAQQVEAKRVCARHCQKAGRAGCTYCNGVGFQQRERLGEVSNQPRSIVR